MNPLARAVAIFPAPRKPMLSSADMGRIVGGQHSGVEREYLRQSVDSKSALLRSPPALPDGIARQSPGRSELSGLDGRRRVRAFGKIHPAGFRHQLGPAQVMGADKRDSLAPRLKRADQFAFLENRNAPRRRFGMYLPI